MKPPRQRAIPSVDKVIRALGGSALPRAVVVDVIRRELSAVRRSKSIPPPDALLERLRDRLTQLDSSRIRPLINGTGVVVHTNLGRAPLSASAMNAVAAVGAGYCNLEYDVTRGIRGPRAGYLERALAVLCRSEASTIVNNNAAALVLILKHFCDTSTSEVIVSRGELVQIGGGFRIPEVLESAGARLREVGTTNRTTAADYARAINKHTSLILKVHHSNFFMDGFVESPTTEDIASIARRKRVPLVEDLGSGAMVQTDRVAPLEHEPTPADVLRQGVDIVCFSGDKLLGGPQAGIIAGRRTVIEGLKREPLFRALRCDKLILAALERTVDAYLEGNSDIPVLNMLSANNDELRVRAESLQARLTGASLTVGIGSGQVQVGGGTLPRSHVPSVTLDVTHATLKALEIAARLRAQDPPVIGYIAQGRLRLDLRTIFPAQDDDVVRALRAVSS